MRSGNPALRGDVFTRGGYYGASTTMSIQGTVNKAFLLLFILILAASWAWANPLVLIRLMLPLVIVAFVVALVTIFKKEWCPVTAPIYAALEGVILGGLSAILEKVYPGIVIQAVSLTFGVLFCLLAAYTSRLIKPTENFKLGIVAATGGIAVLYLVDIVAGFLGHPIPFIHESGIIGIGFSIAVVIIASLNLVLDFDYIEQGARVGAPRYMEWYGAFGLIVTLIWLYLEILNLLSKLRRR